MGHLVRRVEIFAKLWDTNSWQEKFMGLFTVKVKEFTRDFTGVKLVSKVPRMFSFEICIIASQRG